MEKSSVSKKEEEILKFWQESKIFERSVSERPEDKPYVFYDGPPFATGLPHYGHILASTVKDVFPRYYTMRGRRVERRWGWDCHGLPIENIAERELGIKTKKQIEELGVEKFNEFCRSKVLEYADGWKKVISRLGRWADMDNPYKTMDLDFMESVWWVFKELYEKDLIYEGYRSMHICPRCETTLSQSEVTEGYKDIKDLSVTAEFRLIDEPDTSILAWTTTPWTLIGNAALAVGANIDYVKIEKKDLGTGKPVKFILAKDRLQNIFGEDEYKIVDEFKGKELEGKKYQPLFDFYKNENNGWQIVTADFVSTEEGTGVVHIAPAFGEDDMNLAKEKNLPFIQHIGMDGIIKDGNVEFSGLSVKPKDDIRATDKKIIEYLEKKNLLFDSAEYEHSYPHCWRCDTPLLNYATSSWFVAVEKIKDEALELARQITWMPEHIKEGRFGKWLESARDWSISRQRYWASVIPIWVCDKSPEHKVTIGSVEELEKLSGQKITDLHKHIVDKITFKCDRCDGEMKRVADVLDTWFDSGSMPYAQMHYPFANKEKFEANFPAEFIGEGVDQTRAWFYYLHVLSSAIMHKPAFKYAVVNGIILAQDGKKMSKRLNNYPDPMDIINNYGADALRFYLMGSVVMKADNLFFSENDLRDTYNKVINLLGNIVSFYEIYSPKFKVEQINKAELSLLDRWLYSRLNNLILVTTGCLDGYDTVKTCREIKNFIDELSTWWLRRSRDRFKDEADGRIAFSVLNEMLAKLSKIIAPIMPFMAEDIWQKIQINDRESSVHLSLWPEAEKNEISKSLEDDMAVARAIVEAGHSIRAQNSIRVRQPLSGISFEYNFSQNENEFTDLILAELNIEKRLDKSKLADAALAKAGDLEVAVDLKIDERLRGLGMFRDVVRSIQGLRKKLGFKPGEKLRATYFTNGNEAKKFLEQNSEKISSETALSELKATDSEAMGEVGELELGGEKVRISIAL